MTSQFSPLVALLFLTCCYLGSCSSTTNSSSDPNEAFLANTTQTVIPAPRIIGGDEAEENEFPWRCYITSGSEHIDCGCSLIAERWVLTATHCTYHWRRSGITVHLGSHVRDGGNSNEQRIRADYVINHKDYNDNVTLYRNDIALIRLAHPPTLGPNVFPISLPFDFSKEELLGETAVTSGWGITDGSLRRSEILRKTTMQIISNAQCSLVWPYLPDTLVCGLKWGSSTCAGDSGGSLDINRNGTPYIIGVASWFGTGCDITRPTVFTRVTAHLQWIQNYIGQQI